MAKATAKIRTLDNLSMAQETDKMEELQTLLAGHTDDVEQLLRLTQQLREKGLLDAAVASMEQGHDILSILVKQANQPGNLNWIKSLIAVFQGFGEVDPRLVSAVFGGLGEASTIIAGGEAEAVTGLWDIVKVMRDPEVTVGLTAIFAILKSIGRHLGEVRDKSTPADVQSEETAL